MKTSISNITDKLGMPISMLVLSSLLVKAWRDFDPSWDSWYYHLPYAGRLWGIIPAESYRMEQDLEYYYLGFPKLGEWLQGLFWAASGHMQAANLVCLLSLVLYGLFLHFRFGVPFGLSVLSLLAIPLVQIHATSCYVDLPGNLAVAALVLLTWQLFHRTALHAWRDVLPLVPPATVAAHYKFQLILAVLIVLLIALVRIIWLLRSTPLAGLPGSGKMFRWLAIAALTALLIFAVPTKNALVYGNPFYPIRVDIGPIVLKHHIPFHQTSPVYLLDALPPERWMISVLEIDRPFGDWQIGQLSLPVGSPANRMGGFFGAYVVAQLVFMLVLGIGRRDRPAFTDGTIPYFALVSMVVPWLPLSHELRYYLFWMVTLVSLNLILLYRSTQARALRLVVPATNVMTLIAVILLTKGFYILPQGITLDNLPVHIKQLEPFPQVPASLDHHILEDVKSGEEVCVAAQQPITWLYASYFHPPESYRVIAAFDEKTCKRPP